MNITIVIVYGNVRIYCDEKRANNIKMSGNVAVFSSKAVLILRF